MRIQKNGRRNGRRVFADAEIDVAPEATELLFEADDVAELVAEVTGEDVSVEVADEGVEFTVGEDVITVEPEGDEELLEASTRIRGRKAVKASTRARARKRVVRRGRR